MHRRTSGGGGGVGGKGDFGQNANDSGNDNWEKTLKNNAVCVISKTR